MEKKGRIDKYSKELLTNCNYIYLIRYVYPNNNIFFGLAVDTNGYLQSLTTANSGLFFNSEKEAIKYIQRYRSSDLRNPDHSFRIIVRPAPDSYYEPI